MVSAEIPTLAGVDAALLHGVSGQATSCCTAPKANAKALALFSSPAVTPSATTNSGLFTPRNNNTVRI